MLDINWGTLLLQIVNFLVMVFILGRFFFKPVVRILDERSEKVASALDEAERKQNEAEEMRTEYQEKLTEAQEQVISMKQQAQEELARSKKKLLEETRQEITVMRDKAKSELQESRDQAIYQHRRDLGRLVMTLSTRLIREFAGDEFQKASLEGFIERLYSMPADQYDRTLEASDIDLVKVQLVSACGLDDDAKQRVEKRVREMASHPIEMRYKIDPSLVAGATLRFGDMVIDGSLAGQLQSLNDRYIADLERGNV